MRGLTDSKRGTIRSLSWWIYPVTLLFVLLVWVMFMVWKDLFGWFSEFWPMAVTMCFGSFVAGSTPAGGGAVAFPVFTKLLEVPTPVARTFSLMIQSVGMTMASLFILSRKIEVSWAAVRWCLPGGILGLLVSFYGPTPPDPYPRLIFTIVIVVFGVALTISHYGMRWRPNLGDSSRLKGFGNHLHILFVGVIGGYISGLIGSGIDLLGFIALTLAYGFHERLAVPTTVIIMASLSVAGAILFGFSGHSTALEAFPYWLVCVPVVAIGAPFGAWFVSKIDREILIVFVLCLIVLEATSTVVILGLSAEMGMIASIVAVLSAAYFYGMIRHRSSESVKP